MSFMGKYGFQTVGAVIGVVYLVVDILKSTHSTASIGFLFIPVAAALGAFAGDTVKYYADVFLKKRPHSMAKTILVVVVFGFCIHRVIHLSAVAANSPLPEESSQQSIENHLTDYSVMGGVVGRSDLSVSQMERIVSLERDDFKGDAEYELYQTYVWAPLVKRGDISEILIHKLAAKKNPEHFLILALLDSKFVSCDEKKRFLPQTNEVLEGAIRRSMKSSHCLE
jgi:hypothetical protein